MGELNEVVKVKLGWADLLVGVLAIVVTLGGSWVLMKEQVATVVNVSENNKSMAVEAYKKAETNRNDIRVLQRDAVQLEQSTRSYRESLDGLRQVLGQLNITLGRMDERMKNVEEGIERLREEEQ